MGSPNQLSFLPDDYLERKGQRRANAVCAILFLLVMGGIAAGFTLSERATKKVDSDFAKIDDQYLAEAKRLDQVKQMQDKQKTLSRQAELTASLLERVPRSFLLAEVTNAMPAGTSLMDLVLDSKPKPKASGADTSGKSAYELRKAQREANSFSSSSSSSARPPSATAEPKLYDVTMKITGVAQTDVQVAQLINKLSRSKLLKDVNLVISDQFVQNNEKLRKFQIEMMVSPDAEVQVAEKSNTVSVELKE